MNSILPTPPLKNPTNAHREDNVGASPTQRSAADPETGGPAAGSGPELNAGTVGNRETECPPLTESHNPSTPGNRPRPVVMTANITNGYRQLFVFYFGAANMRAAGLSPGRIVVTVRENPDLMAEGNLNSNGTLSGMSPLYRGLGLRDGDVLEAEPAGASAIVVTGVIRSGGDRDSGASQVVDGGTPKTSTRSVFQRQELRALHIEVFSPENLNRWEPATETDVYMAFGVLQEYTRHRYCCATSQHLLDRLGFNAPTKPDAILVDNDTREYLVAEFKMRSSAFRVNHRPEDVDVLVVWDDDEKDRSVLPMDIVCLREIARQAAQELILG